MMNIDEFNEWVYQVAIGVDQQINALLGGSADETMSSRCFRLNHIRTYRVLELGVNALFHPFQGPDHCEHAYMKEVFGRQVPEEFYKRAFAMNIEMDKNKLGPNIEMPQV
jgi:hypothetical protein